ncbi:MAG TPA: helix-turn-helix domain-containing protein [Bacteroidia bacterium]
MQIKDQAIQKNFVEILKHSIPSNLNLADELSQILGISNDSSYRRLRCETEFTLTEVLKLCEHFNVPLESLTNNNSESVTFKTNRLNQDKNSFTQYLEGLYRDLSWLQKFDRSEIVYAAEDLPVFYSLLFPVLARFKMCYWTKSILNVPEMQKLKIEDVNLPDTWQETTGKINSLFLKVKSIEIWNSDTLKSTVEQIKFYWDSGFFREKKTALELTDELRSLLNTIEQQAEVGRKFNYHTGQFSQAEYVLYFSDLMIGNNHVFIKGEDKEATYIGYNSFNYMRTGNRSFNEQVELWQKNLMSKSILLSQVSEKQRRQFFKTLNNQISDLVAIIESD